MCDSDVIISKKSLKNLLSMTGATLVGKILRRFEILSDNINGIKASTKELIYEEFRTLERLLSAHSEGRELEIFRISKINKEG